MKKTLIFFFAFTLTGCATATIEKVPGSGGAPVEYAPVNKSNSDYGVVSYLDEGISSIRKIRRDDAFKKMHELCNGKYRIINESYGESNPVYSVNKNLISTLTSTYVFFTFECVK